MAVTVDDLRGALGIAEVSAPPNEDANDRTEREAVNTRNLAIASRLHAICKAEVERYAAAPEHHRDEALIRMAGYRTPTTPRSARCGVCLPATISRSSRGHRERRSGCPVPPRCSRRIACGGPSVRRRRRDRAGRCGRAAA